MTISTRPELPQDETFLRRLVLDTIAQQLHAELWPAQIRESLLEMQWNLRRKAATSARAGATSEIILADGESAGWLVVAELAEEVRLTEIMVSVERRGKGIGSAVIRDVLARGARVGKPVRLHVSLTNPGAVQLYARLGFRLIAQDEMNATMQYAGEHAG